MAAAPAKGAEQSVHLFPVLIMARRALRRLLNLMAGFVIATVAIEIGFQLIAATPLRWVLPLPAAAFYGPDPDTGYRHRVNASGVWLTENRAHARISNLGLRDRDRSIEHGRAPRAIVLGDSFIEALQVDWPQTAVAVAERILGRDIPGAEVVNLGLAGAQPAVEIARLRAQGLALSPDVAVVVITADHLLSPALTDDSEVTGYRRADDGEFRLSFRFRESPGYLFRTSTLGQIVYWLLDHSQAMRILNARKNIGILAEWSPAPAREVVASARSCTPAALDSQIALWINEVPADRRQIVDAFIRDLSAIHRTSGVPIVVAIRGIDAHCPALDGKRASLIDAIRTKFEAAGLQFVDLDARVVARVGRGGVSELYGFGPSLGYGHLNVKGNRVYGEILAETIRAALPGGR
jgi:hypothetical protein